CIQLSDWCVSRLLHLSYIHVAPTPSRDADSAMAIDQRSAYRYGRPREVVAREVRGVIAARSRMARKLAKARSEHRPPKKGKEKQDGTAPTGRLNTPVSGEPVEKGKEAGRDAKSD